MAGCIRYFAFPMAFSPDERVVSPQEDPDVQLMLAIKADDQEAFEKLFRRHIGRVARFARGMVRSEARAEEIAQEAFAHVYRTRHSYEPRARFLSWLYRIVTNLCITELRRPEHRVRIRGSGSEEEFELDSLPDPEGGDSEARILSMERIRRMRNAIARLPEQQRAAVLLAREEGLPYTSVAEALGVSVAAVKSLIHRATLTLREELAKIERG